MIKPVVAAALVCLALSTASLAQSGAGWERYDDRLNGFSVELPFGLFEPSAQSDTPSQLFLETDGDGQITLYSGDAAGMTLDDFAARLSADDPNREITYRAEGGSWFVLSGFSQSQIEGVEPLIFYTKVLFSADGERFSGFEVSYPVSDKIRYDAIIERIEDSFTRPR
ncbi:hypothetical protein [Devosia rhizoryzae]|uniref:Uncharacterized protein n=1 Tax=Devosia rhizoryzae TaxID=2774137 RepID=A0ABX7CCK4_9HYPH|nr:hypothetical protein [Devosia rhizoryzae]QQR40345.1 hypothetical protein JI748_04870 [Devosia rhizoryzae]